MRKFYSFFAFAVMMMVSLTAKAAVAAETLTSNLETVVSYFEGYGVYHYYNFKTMARDGGESQAFTIAADPIDALMPITTPGFENFLVAVGRGTNENPDLRWRDANYGLYEFGSGARTFRTTSLKAGMILVIQGAQGQSYDYFANGVVNASEAEEITDEVTEKMNEGLEEGAEPVTNPYRYFRILADGKFDFSVNRGCYLLSAAILLDQSAGEAVSTPSLKIVGVDGAARKLEFKPGESTMGNETKTFYSIDGSDPLFLKDSEEVATWTYTYDEETGEKLDSVPETYKRVLDLDAVKEYGTYGDYEYNPEDGYVDVLADADEDGDGIVVVKAAAVSIETGVVSDIVTINVSVGEIQLNAPTFALSGINGEERTYTIGWANNTLCGEDYSLLVETGEGGYAELDPNTGIGSTVTSAISVKVTVRVNGYLDGVVEEAVVNQGVNIKRKNVVVDEEGNVAHDWDFVNISADQQAMFIHDSSNPAALSGCYVKTETDSLTYSVQEFIDGVALDGTDLSSATPLFKETGWYFPISSDRTTLNVVEGGKDANANDMGYVDDMTGIFNGLTISCPPAANNNSCIFKYIDKADWADGGYNGDGITKLGVYFMSKPTITFPREVAAAGEYVAIYHGVGGSNYTNTRTLSFYEVPVGELLSVTLANGVHVFYIDIYTYEGLPTDEYDPSAEDETAVATVKPGIQKIVGYYSTNGAKLAAPAKGINIVKYADGSTMKVLVK